MILQLLCSLHFFPSLALQTQSWGKAQPKWIPLNLLPSKREHSRKKTLLHACLLKLLLLFKLECFLFKYLFSLLMVTAAVLMWEHLPGWSIKAQTTLKYIIYLCCGWKISIFNQTTHYLLFQASSSSEEIEIGKIIKKKPIQQQSMVMFKTRLWFWTL